MATLWTFDQECDCTYKHYRDSSHQHPSMVRNVLQHWWEDAKPYLDKDFPKQLCEQPYPRFWELRLATLLLENGKHIVPVSERGTRGAGPDFLIEDDNGRTWVEAATITPGQVNSPERVSNIEFGESDLPPMELIRNRPTANDLVELRISSTISDKMKSYDRYLEKGIVGKNDRTLIAVNTGNMLNRKRENRGTPLCVVYPIGDLYYDFSDPKDGGGAFYGSRFQIQKKPDTMVDIGYFSFIEYQHITGVIWSTFSVDDFLFPSYDLCYFPNPCAMNPLDRKYLDWTYEWIYDITGDTVEINKVSYNERDSM